jgi:GntR family transcriptional regulator
MSSPGSLTPLAPRSTWRGPAAFRSRRAAGPLVGDSIAGEGVDISAAGCIVCLMEVGKVYKEGGEAPRVSPVDFSLDLASGVPTYLQLVQQVERALRLGYLVPGDQLPKVRDVVAKLAINPNTVLKAYKALEMKGLAVGRPGQGTFIVGTLSQVALPELTELRRSLTSWVAAADAAGLDEDAIAALVAGVLRDFRERRDGEANRRRTTQHKAEGVA